MQSWRKQPRTYVKCPNASGGTCQRGDERHVKPERGPERGGGGCSPPRADGWTAQPRFVVIFLLRKAGR